MGIELNVLTAVVGILASGFSAYLGVKIAQAEMRGDIKNLEEALGGKDGEGGLKGDVKDLQGWRHGTPPYGPQNLESRCNHEARNIVQAAISRVELELIRDRRRGGQK